MKQALIKRGKLIVADVPAPLVEQGHVLVAVGYSVISAGTELAGIRTSQKGLLRLAAAQPDRIRRMVDHLRRQGAHRTVALVQQKMGAPMPIGYSCAGTVVQVGAAVTDLQVGDQVACAGAGKANHAEWVVVPRNLVAPVPKGISLRDAASTTLGAIAMQGVRRADLRLGEWGAVIGLGLLGQITAQLLRAAGVRAIGFDLEPRRVEEAKSLGMPYAFVSVDVDPLPEVFHLTQGHGVDATIITAASQSDAIVQQAMQLTRTRGRVVVVGDVGLALKRSPFYEKELDFLIARSYGPGRYDPRYESNGLDYPYAYVRWTENRNMTAYLQLLAEGRVDFGGLVEAEYPLEQADQAYALLQQEDSRPIAIVLRYPDAPAPAAVPTHRVVLRAPRPPDGRIRVALVGAGAFAKATHLPNLERLSDLYHLRGVVSRTGSNAWTTGEQLGADYVTTDYDEVLADPEVDMVLIATRHHLHAEQGIRAAEAGKAIFMEKPMALNQNEMDRLVTALEETGVPFMIGFNRRFSPAAQRAREILTERRSPLMILYRVNAGYIALDHWVHTREGGGRIVGEACHMLDLSLFLVSPAKAVEVVSTAIVPKAEHISATDNVVTTVRCDDGSVATLLYTALGSSDFSKEYVEIYAGGTVLVIDDYRALRVHGARERGWASGTQDKGHLEELRAFSKYVRGESGPPIPLESLVEVTRVTLLAAGATDEVRRNGQCDGNAQARA